MESAGLCVRHSLLLPLIIYVMMITLTCNPRPLILEINAGQVRVIGTRSPRFEDNACLK
jgi:hypothetical protein